MIRTLSRDYKSLLKKAVLCAVLGGLVAFIGYQVSLRSEVLTYAWNNQEKVTWLIAGDQKAQADSQLKLKEAIARLYVEQ